MRFCAPLALAAGCLAVTASIALGAPLAAVAQAPHPQPDPEAPRDPFADVPPVAVTAQGRTIQAAFLGGSWTTPSGQPVASAPPCCLKLGPRQTLPVRSRAWFDVVLREPVARVRVFALVGSRTTSFFRVVPDARDPLRWHVRAPRLRRGTPAKLTSIEVSYSRGVVHYRFLMAPKRHSG